MSDSGIEETKGPSAAWADNGGGSPELAHVKSLSTSLTLGKSLRHEIKKDLAEPKVLSPHKTRAGNPPRRIEVERKKREFASFDISTEMNNNGVTEHLRQSRKNCEESVETIDQYPLSYFDNTEYDSQPIEFWRKLVADPGDGGVLARALFVSPPIPQRPKVIGEKVDSLVRNYRDIFWSYCKVTGYNPEKDVFTVFFSAQDSGSITHEDSVRELERIYICFEAESPKKYCERLAGIIETKKIHYASISLNLYTDCMPMENLNPLDSESVNRVLEKAINTEVLRRNAMLDTSSVLQQYNLNHMRTMNQIIFADIMAKREEDVRSVHSNSYDAQLLKSLASPDAFSKNKGLVRTDAEQSIGEKIKAFRFASLTSTNEVNTIMLSIQNEVVGLNRQSFFMNPDKSMRIEEFSLTQQTQATAMAQAVREGWLNSITNAVRNNLKEIKKGWFNIDETSIDIYNFSKLRKFLVMINMVMESSIRSLMTDRVADYVDMISSFCPTSVIVHSNEKATFEGRKADFPLFNVDLKFVNSSEENPEAKFVYSVQPEAIKSAILDPFDKSFALLSGIVKVERRIMKKLFWPSDPKVQIPNIGEDWAQSLRAQLESTLDAALAPMEEYIGTLVELMGLIRIDMDSYVASAVEQYCGGEVLNLADLCKLALRHEEDSATVVHMLPSNVTIGLVNIDCKTVKVMLSQKHKQISSTLMNK